MEPRSYCRFDCPIRAGEFNVWRAICGVLLLTSLIVSTVSQDITDFISIDCGVDGGKDLLLDLEWLTDEDFLQWEQLLDDLPYDYWEAQLRGEYIFPCRQITT
ncbi:hypothetical protein R1flu_022751 [Riccia fluitans]|uniref:Uncharacterized protein n=1 Tax=Riccia fluitans TaxID=41844 RepID=A0ABD1XQ54_9MARC